MKTTFKWLKVLIAVGLLAIIGGGVMFYFITKQPDSFVTQKLIRPVVGFISGFQQFENVDEAKPAFTLTPGELQGAFAKDEAKARATYAGKIVEVKGTISSIAQSDSNRVILLEVDGMSNISCQMDPQFNNRLKDISAGKVVSIKGICHSAKKDD